VVLQQAAAGHFGGLRPILFRYLCEFSSSQAAEPAFLKRIGLAVVAVRQQRSCPNPIRRSFIMLGWVITFLVIALIAGLLGFGGIAGASIEIAKIIFFIALVLFLVSAVAHIARGRRI
jgi:uncharacterized membrane protein YtjA (UPF0391 family)